MHYHVEEIFQVMAVKLWLNEVLTRQSSAEWINASPHLCR